MLEIHKPWGRELWFAQTDKYVGKIIEVDAGERLSLQYHEVKDETMYIWSGLAILTLNEQDITLSKGDAVRIKPNQIHRLKALTYTIILEVSTSEVDDIIRIDDDYGRVGDAK